MFLCQFEQKEDDEERKMFNERCRLEDGPLKLVNRSREDASNASRRDSRSCDLILVSAL